ncbi:hypothetical protein DC522_20015 [Microvirga sp. KLBC 81]|nr:hypothetical protein DC522_20015 [Microvirga sp. KLBC 81]
MSRHINFLVYQGFVLLDLSGPTEVFSWHSRMSALVVLLRRRLDDYTARGPVVGIRTFRPP